MKYLIIIVFLLPFKVVMAQERSRASLLSEAETRLKPNSPAYNPAAAFKIYLKTASDGVAKSMNALGILYSQGLGVEQDSSAALKWFNKAANSGYVNAWFNLGQMYKGGIGVKQNFKTAIKYYQRGIESASPNGYYGYGYMKYKGLGCEQNYEEAFKLFQKGIQWRSISSMYMIALCYRNGYGTKANLDSARYFLQKAANAHYQFAIDEMEANQPENPDFANYKSPDVKKGNSKKLSATKFFKSKLAADQIAGEYVGYIIKYDWSGEHVIEKSRLKLQINRGDSILTGNWQEDQDPAVHLSAKLTDSLLLFNNTSFSKKDHYNQREAIPFEFRNAALQLTKTADSVLLTGSLQLWSVKLNEPEKPIFISLVREKNYSDLVNRNTTATQDSLITGFIAYPNPFTDSFQVQYTTLKEVTSSITLTDVLTGRTVYTKKPERLRPGKQSETIVANIMPGTYVLRLVYGNKVKSTLVIKK